MKTLDDIKIRYNLSLLCIDTDPLHFSPPHLHIKFFTYDIYITFSYKFIYTNYDLCKCVKSMLENELSKNSDYKNYMRSIKINNISNKLKNMNI
jgi:hypothetical protein